MRRAMLAVSTALLIGAALTAPATAGTKPEKPGFAERLAAGQIVFAPVPVEPLSIYEANENYDIARIVEAEGVANEILDRLIAASPVPATRRPTFFVTAGIEFNCSAMKSGGAISCSHHALQMLIDAGPRGRDQFAFLLAHELAHAIILDHRTRFDRSDAVKGGWAKAGTMAGILAMVALNKYTTSGNTTTVHPTMAANNMFFGLISAGADAGETVNGIVAPSWSKQNEAEADSFAILMMQRAGYNPREAAQLLGTVDKEQRGIAKARPNDLLTKAGTNLATQAILSHGNPISMGIGMGTGLITSLVTKDGGGHYHDDTSKRAAACAQQASALRAGMAKPDEAETLFAQAEAAEAAEAAAAAAPTPAPPVAAPAAPPARRGRKRAARSPAPAPQIVPKDSWQVMTERAAPALRELTMAAMVNYRRVTKDVPGALSLCPSAQPRTRQLMLSCGTAQVAAGNGAVAAALLRRAAADPTADAETFRRVSLAQADLGIGPEALATIDAGQRRYPDGQLYPTEIALRAGLGDLAGAKAAAQRCGALPDKPLQENCRKTLAAIATQKKG